MVCQHYVAVYKCVYCCQAPRTADTRLLRAAISLESMVSNTFCELMYYCNSDQCMCVLLQSVMPHMGQLVQQFSLFKRQPGRSSTKCSMHRTRLSDAF
jgi:hypothetical protein